MCINMLVERKAMYIGIDIGGTKCAVVTADSQGTLRDRTAFPTGPSAPTLAKIEEIIEGFSSVQAKEISSVRAKGISSIQAIGISCGGPLNEETGRILSPPNLPGWDDVPIAERLMRRFQVPVRLRNDANACALAEWKFGAGRGLSNLIFLTFGTGLGAGLILNGQLYSGTNGNAGEVGHIRLLESGPVGYGKAGSFEGFCSGGGLRQISPWNGFSRVGRRLSAGRRRRFLKSRPGCLPTMRIRAIRPRLRPTGYAEDALERVSRF